MFDNIGKKIKSVAKFNAYFFKIIGLSVAIIGALVLGYVGVTFLGVLIWAICAIVITYFLIFSTYLLYAFGQIVENSDKIVSLLSNENNKSNESNTSTTETSVVFTAPTSPADATLTTNPVSIQVTNQAPITQSPADIVSELKVFACPYCGKKYKARPMSRVVCPHCHMKIN